MSQMVTRKSGSSEEKEKRHTDSPVKDMKKKMAANAEKEKQATDKTADKPAEKSAESSKQNEKKAPEKPAEKKPEKNGPVTEKSDKKDKDSGSKDKDSSSKDKKETEKKDDGKQEKGGKPDKEKDAKAKESKDTKCKQNGAAAASVRAHNGVSDVTLAAAREPSANGDAHSEEEGVLVIDSEPETERDELFPELAYDDDSDGENGVQGDRSITRRSQVKPTRTPETPRPASDKQADKEAPPTQDDSKDKEKVLKMKDGTRSSSTDRKLRSSDPPKGDQKKQEKSQGQDAAKKTEAEKKAELEVVIEVENEDEPRKPDTNYSKSRVKVSPYRRSARLADQTTSSVMANYTGNNTTMEMDITETSSFISEDVSGLDDSSYLSGLRSIRGRRSYKPLKEITIRHVANKSLLKTTGESTRPTAPVVGRKRKPDVEDSVEVASEAHETSEPAATPSVAHAKRMRLLDRISAPFRRNTASRCPEIVGINTDLPLSAPTSSPETIDPESLKTPLSASSPLPVAPEGTDRDGKRCVVM